MIIDHGIDSRFPDVAESFVGEDIVVADVDVGLMNLEVVINLDDLGDQPKVGSICARGYGCRVTFWMNGCSTPDTKALIER